MATSEKTLEMLAKISLNAENERKEIESFKKTYPDITPEEAYRGMKMRLDMSLAQGNRLIGAKLGNTSMAKLAQVRETMTLEGVKVNADPSYGFLMDYMQLGEDDVLRIDELIHPKVETELAFVTKKELYGPYIYSVDVMNATEYVVPAFEIIDSRYKDFKVGGLTDAVLDNVSSARFKLGKVKKDPCEIDMVNMAVRTNINGEYVNFGSSGAVLGHPARAVSALVRLLYQYMDMPLPAGPIVLSGAIIPSTFLHKGDKVRSDFSDLGSIELEVV